MPSLETLVPATLHRAIIASVSAPEGPEGGRQFQQILFTSLRNAHLWRYATGPNQLDMGLLAESRTGTRYEFDSVFVTDETLFVIEAKRYLQGGVTREDVGVFIQKLLDTLLGSDESLGHLRILPIIVSGTTNVDAAALQLAVGWGILTISPARLTPFEILYELDFRQLGGPTADRLRANCHLLGPDLWRPFNRFVSPAQTARLFALDETSVYRASRISELLEQWAECVEDARALNLGLAQTLPVVAFPPRDAR